MQFKAKGILSYPHLFTPRAPQGSNELKYSLELLLAKNDPQLQQIQQLVESAKMTGFPSGLPANAKLCLLDCVEAKSDDPRYHPYMLLRANNKDQPDVVDTNLQPLMDQKQVTAGMMAWVSGVIKPYNNVSKGIGCYVNGVLATGEMGPLGRLDNRPSVQAMFGDINTMQPAIMPQNAQSVNAMPPVTPTAPTAPVMGQPQATPQYIMTDKAEGIPRENYHASGWTDEMLIQHGYMIQPSFV